MLAANGKSSPVEIEKVIKKFEDEDITCLDVTTLRWTAGTRGMMNCRAEPVVKRSLTASVLCYSDDQFKELGVQKMGQIQELRRRATASASIGQN